MNYNDSLISVTFVFVHLKLDPTMHALVIGIERRGNKLIPFDYEVIFKVKHNSSSTKTESSSSSTFASNILSMSPLSLIPNP